MAPLGLDAWWDEPPYKQAYTQDLRGEFILGKLKERDPKKYQALLADIFHERDPLPEAVTASEWRTILAEMGASVSEIADVLTRMGRQAG